jgi:uncharacterized protein
VLEVTFYRDARDRLTGLTAFGHADFAEHGEDVVCAAVSAILQAVALGLTEYARADLGTARQESGQLELRWGKEDRESESVRAIVATAELAIDQISQQYPAHVRLNRARTEESREARHAGG